MPPKQLTEGSPAVKKLREMFKAKQIDSNSKPKEVWESTKNFQDYKLDNFRSKLNRLKDEYQGKFHVLIIFIFQNVIKRPF